MAPLSGGDDTHCVSDYSVADPEGGGPGVPRHPFIFDDQCICIVTYVLHSLPMPWVSTRLF